MYSKLVFRRQERNKESLKEREREERDAERKEEEGRERKLKAREIGRETIEMTKGTRRTRSKMRDGESKKRCQTG